MKQNILNHFPIMVEFNVWFFDHRCDTVKVRIDFLRSLDSSPIDKAVNSLGLRACTKCSHGSVEFSKDLG